MKQLLMGRKSKKEDIQTVDQEDTQLKKDMKLG